MTHSGTILADLLQAIPKARFLTRVKVLKIRVKNGVTLAKFKVPKLSEKQTEYYVNKGKNELNKTFI